MTWIKRHWKGVLGLLVAVGLVLGATYTDTRVYILAGGARISDIQPLSTDLTMTIGSATAQSITLTTDSTGNGEIVLPGFSVGSGEIAISAGAAPAATCTVGELFIDTDETDDTNCTTTADNSLCVCHATNTWASTE